MKFPEHVAVSFLFAQFGVQQQYGVGGSMLMILAGNLPDADTLTLFGGLRFYRKYHRDVIVRSHNAHINCIEFCLPDAGYALSDMGAEPVNGHAREMIQHPAKARHR